MKNKGIISVIALIFATFCLQAQTPLTEGGGPSVNRCNAALSNHILLKQDDKSAVFYLNTYSNNPKQQYQGIVTYNKSTGTAFNEDMVLPDGYRPLSITPCGDSYFACYYRFNREKKNFEYATATFPQKKSTDGIRKVEPTVRLSFDLADRGDILKYTAASPDKSKFAVVFIAPDANNRAPYFYCFIYDNTGKELWYDKFIPNITGNKFFIHDIALTHKGELVLLINSAKSKSSTVQLFFCKQGEINSIDEPVDFGFANSMKMLRLKSNEIFIGGYYAPSQQGKSVGFFNLVYNPDKNKITQRNHDTFDFKEEPVYDELTEADYNIKCDYLFELPDKIVMMLGEQHSTFQQHGEKSSLAYRHVTNNIYGNKFSLTGSNLGVVCIRRHIGASSGTLATIHDDGERIGSYILSEKNAAPRNPTFTNLGISYSPIVKDNTIYVLYEDIAKNYAEDSDDWEAASVEKADENCVVLARLDYSADKKVVMMPSKAAQSFHDIWCIDGNTIYFGMSGKKDYSIQKFKLDGKWSWDR